MNVEGTATAAPATAAEGPTDAQAAKIFESFAQSFAIQEMLKQDRERKEDDKANDV